MVFDNSKNIIITKI